jgi:hypothetical protein
MPEFRITEEEREELLAMEEDAGTIHYLGMQLHEEIFRLAERAGLGALEAGRLSTLVGLAAWRIDNSDFE